MRLLPGDRIKAEEDHCAENLVDMHKSIIAGAYHRRCRGRRFPWAFQTLQWLRTVRPLVGAWLAMFADTTKADDVTETGAVAGSFFRRTTVPLQPRGIFHAAGTLADASLANQSAAGVRAVAAPKVSGLAALERAAAGGGSGGGGPLGVPIVLFSSVSSLLGWRGQANYAVSCTATITSFKSGFILFSSSFLHSFIRK